jgi:O-antigen/teichoic acid export membrane protein
MTSTRVVARNVLCNWAGMAAHLLTGFVLAPFLVRHLGVERYGLWVLIGSLAGYFTLLDLGVGAAVGRNVAYRRARGDAEGALAILSTALVLLGSVGVLTVVGTAGVILAFPYLFSVPADQAAAVPLVLFLVGLNLAVTFPSYVFDGTLWALQRFDLLNAVAIPVQAARVALTLYLVPLGGGLAALALIILGTTLAGTSAKALICRRLVPGLWPRRGHVRREAAHALWGYGIWYFFLSMERPIASQVLPAVIGYRLSGLGVAYVTPHNIATRLTAYATSFLIAGTQVLTPLATALHAGGKRNQQQRLFLEGGKYCLALELFFFTLFVWLGQPFLGLWIGHKLEFAWQLLVILALGEVLPMSQWVSYGLVLGMGRHKVLAWLSIVETVVALALALVRPFGLPGVCVAVAVPGAVFRGACQMVYACRLLKVPLRTYLASAFVPALLTAAGPAAALSLLTHWHAPETWASLVACTTAFGALYLATACVGLIGLERVRSQGREALRGLLGAR